MSLFKKCLNIAAIAALVFAGGMQLSHGQNHTAQVANGQHTVQQTKLAAVSAISNKTGSSHTAKMPCCRPDGLCSSGMCQTLPVLATESVIVVHAVHQETAFFRQDRLYTSRQPNILIPPPRA